MAKFESTMKEKYNKKAAFDPVFILHVSSFKNFITPFFLPSISLKVFLSARAGILVQSELQLEVNIQSSENLESDLHCFLG